ncbi:aldo/keto reductase [Streptomyces bicolor]|uniref:aldo/keto reductase n=1 Tax=Streptomyces bicolor TaxID=66874 RepID=UPI003CC8027B
MTPPAGTITIAGKNVSRLGFGTMRLTGPGTWGHPDDFETAVSVLRQAVHTYGITHIDTADAYGPHTAELLVRHALYPYPDDLLIATKVGMVRPAPDVWAPHGHPVYLRAIVKTCGLMLDQGIGLVPRRMSPGLKWRSSDPGPVRTRRAP